jgi:fumarylacetoacetase
VVDELAACLSGLTPGRKPFRSASIQTSVTKREGATFLRNDLAKLVTFVSQELSGLYQCSESETLVLHEIQREELGITAHTMTSLRSWFSIPRGSHFSLANVPFGIISTASSTSPRVAVAIGDYALDLEAFAASNGFSALSIIQPHQAVFSQPSLNAFAALGRPMHSVVRKYIQSIFTAETPYPDVLKNNIALQKQALIPLASIKAHLPFKIGDYTDFFAGMNHAYNCGVLFRGPANALQPNYKHLPVGYHGRASSVVPSGTPIRRPNGQILLDPTAENKVPTLSPCKKLDIELELGAFVCGSNPQGVPIPIEQAENNLFGVVLMNDWSARDIQAWEYVPLGPFNAKNFGTTISTWVVLVDALEPFKTKGLENDAGVLPYMREKDEKTVYNINLEVDLKCKSCHEYSQYPANMEQHPPEALPQSPKSTHEISSGRFLKCWHITQSLAVPFSQAIF